MKYLVAKRQYFINKIRNKERRQFFNEYRRQRIIQFTNKDRLDEIGQSEIMSMLTIFKKEEISFQQVIYLLKKHDHQFSLQFALGFSQVIHSNFRTVNLALYSLSLLIFKCKIQILEKIREKISIKLLLQENLEIVENIPTLINLIIGLLDRQSKQVILPAIADYYEKIIDKVSCHDLTFLNLLALASKYPILRPKQDIIEKILRYNIQHPSSNNHVQQTILQIVLLYSQSKISHQTFHQIWEWISIVLKNIMANLFDKMNKQILAITICLIQNNNQHLVIQQIIENQPFIYWLSTVSKKSNNKCRKIAILLINLLISTISGQLLANLVKKYSWTECLILSLQLDLKMDEKLSVLYSLAFILSIDQDICRLMIEFGGFKQIQKYVQQSNFTDLSQISSNILEYYEDYLINCQV